MSLEPSRSLAAYLSSLRYDDIPAAVRERVIDILLDTVASAIAGRDGADAAQVRALALAIGGEGASTVVARSPTSLAGSALINGYQITAANLCDIHRPTFCHVTPTVVPPALAVAEQRAISGRHLITAIAAGLETVIRIGTAIDYPAMRAKGWNAPGVIGPFGGAASVASLLGFEADRFGHALALAGSQSAGTFASLGTPAIKFHQSRASLSGLLAALLAEQGFPGGAQILVAEKGGIFNLYSNGGNPEALTVGLGDIWRLSEISLRRWPVAASVQSVIAATLAIVEKQALQPDDVASMEIELSGEIHKMYGAMPDSPGFRAPMSAGYIASAALFDRKFWFEQLQPARLADPAINAFMTSRVRVVAGEAAAGVGSTVKVTTASGSTYVEARDLSDENGSDLSSRDEIIAKFVACSEHVLGREKTESAIDMIVNLSSLSNVFDLCSVLNGPASNNRA